MQTLAYTTDSGVRPEPGDGMAFPSRPPAMEALETEPMSPIGWKDQVCVCLGGYGHHATRWNKTYIFQSRPIQSSRSVVRFAGIDLAQGVGTDPDAGDALPLTRQECLTLQPFVPQRIAQALGSPELRGLKPFVDTRHLQDPDSTLRGGGGQPKVGHTGVFRDLPRVENFLAWHIEALQGNPSQVVLVGSPGGSVGRGTWLLIGHLLRRNYGRDLPLHLAIILPSTRLPVYDRLRANAQTWTMFLELSLYERHDAGIDTTFGPGRDGRNQTWRWEGDLFDTVLLLDPTVLAGNPLRAIGELLWVWESPLVTDTLAQRYRNEGTARRRAGQYGTAIATAVIHLDQDVLAELVGLAAGESLLSRLLQSPEYLKGGAKRQVEAAFAEERVTEDFADRFQWEGASLDQTFDYTFATWYRDGDDLVALAKDVVAYLAPEVREAIVASLKRVSQSLEAQAQQWADAAHYPAVQALWAAAADHSEDLRQGLVGKMDRLTQELQALEPQLGAAYGPIAAASKDPWRFQRFPSLKRWLGPLATPQTAPIGESVAWDTVQQWGRGRLRLEASEALREELARGGSRWTAQAQEARKLLDSLEQVQSNLQQQREQAQGQLRQAEAMVNSGLCLTEDAAAVLQAKTSPQTDWLTRVNRNRGALSAAEIRESLDKEVIQPASEWVGRLSRAEILSRLPEALLHRIGELLSAPRWSVAFDPTQLDSDTLASRESWVLADRDTWDLLQEKGVLDVGIRQGPPNLFPDGHLRAVHIQPYLSPRSLERMEEFRQAYEDWPSNRRDELFVDPRAMQETNGYLDDRAVARVLVQGLVCRAVVERRGKATHSWWETPDDIGPSDDPSTLSWREMKQPKLGSNFSQAVAFLKAHPERVKDILQRYEEAIGRGTGPAQLDAEVLRERLLALRRCHKEPLLLEAVESLLKSLISSHS